MKNLLNTAVVLTVLLTIVLGCVSQSNFERKGVFADAAGLENEIRNKIGKFPPNWESVKFAGTGIENDSITIEMRYSEKPTIPVLEADTKQIAQAVLDVLRSKGYDPQKRRCYVKVRADLCCGRPNPLGTTKYNPDNDNLEFSKDWWNY